MFECCTCESAGIPSQKMLVFLKRLEGYGLSTHSIIMARRGKVFTECHYAPFDASFCHRMYSASKSFVSVAIGLAYTEGLLSLDDRITDYFPEYRNAHTDALYDETTIRDMLTMRSNIAGFKPWWGKYDDRVEAYYAQSSAKIPGTVFFYDSMGSYLLGCIVEKLTGKTFLGYLKDKFLLRMGFSPESRVLYAPGKYTLGDSGVMCTSRDLLIFAKFVMDGGVFDGVRYIDGQFMKDATSALSCCNADGTASVYKSFGYGYLIWKMPRDGFAFIGMGDQLAICDREHDVIFVMTADNQRCEGTSRELILAAFYSDIIGNISSAPLPEDPESQKELGEYISRAKLMSVQGSTSCTAAQSIGGKRYTLEKNPLGITEFVLDFDGNCGEFRYRNADGCNTISFGIGHNVCGQFPGRLRNSEIAGTACCGSYRCASSGAWQTDGLFHIKTQIIDTYFGCLDIQIGFRGKRATLCFKKSGQYILDGFDGYINGKQEES